MPTPGNSINEATTGICGFTGTAFTGTAATAHNVLVGGATSSTITNVAPSATSGVALVSGGASADPSFTTVAIAGGGTNAVSMSTNTGIVKYNGTSLVTSSTAKIDSSDRQTNTSQPCFLVQIQTTISNVTGDGTVYSVLFDTTTYDQGSNITLNSSGKTIFTAPVTGKYLLQANINLNTLTAAQQTQIRCITTARTFFAGFDVTNVGNSIALPFTCFCDMSANDTAYIQVYQGGASKNASVAGSGSATSGLITWFSGALIC